LGNPKELAALRKRSMTATSQSSKTIISFDWIDFVTVNAFTGVFYEAKTILFNKN